MKDDENVNLLEMEPIKFYFMCSLNKQYPVLCTYWSLYRVVRYSGAAKRETPWPAWGCHANDERQNEEDGQLLPSALWCSQTYTACITTLWSLSGWWAPCRQQKGKITMTPYLPYITPHKALRMNITPNLQAGFLPPHHDTREAVDSGVKWYPEVT